MLLESHRDLGMPKNEAKFFDSRDLLERNRNSQTKRLIASVCLRAETLASFFAFSLFGFLRFSITLLFFSFFPFAILVFMFFSTVFAFLDNNAEEA